jgi:hypothetical protein
MIIGDLFERRPLINPPIITKYFLRHINLKAVQFRLAL